MNFKTYASYKQDIDSIPTGATPIVCDHCCGEFMIKSGQLRQNIRRNYLTCFCSAACRGKHKSVADTHHLTCSSCNTPVIRRSSELTSSGLQFCSHSCSATYLNKLAPKRGVEGTCIYCQKPTATKNNFCSKDCRERHLLEKSTTKEEKRDMHANNTTTRRHRWKIKAVELMGGCCLLCGYSKCLRSLTFHHQNPNEKDFSISSFSGSWDKIAQELKKCILVCANCHGQIHHDIAESKGRA